MKKYTVIMWRSNPQLANGGYQTEREVEAKTIASARKKARELAERSVYGSMRVLDVYLKEVQA